MISTLQANSSVVSFDSNSFLWKINANNIPKHNSMGFTHVKDLVHASEYLYKSEYIYIQPNKEINVVVSPNLYKYLKNEYNFVRVHNTAFRHFPKADNGYGPIRHGYKVVFDDEIKKTDFLYRVKTIIDSFVFIANP